MTLPAYGNFRPATTFIGGETAEYHSPGQSVSQLPATALSRCGIESSSSMFSATDIASFLACPHTATLDRAESKDKIVKPFFRNAAVDLLRKLGLEHEQRYLRELAEPLLPEFEVHSHPSETCSVS